MKKILIVDDEWEIRRTLEYLLKNSGYQVVSAASANEAMAKTRAEKPDLILLDYCLPDMDGGELIRILKAEKVDAPFILITALGGQDDLDKLKKTGVADFIGKPFELDDLQVKIKKILLRPRPKKEKKAKTGRPHK